MRNKKAFTLIELVSVLVILAILALIVTLLVLNIIRKARTAADKRSIDAYGRSIELAIADYLLENGTFPTSIEQLTIEYTGERVICSTTQLNSDSSVYLADCTVNSRVVTGYKYGKEDAVMYNSYNVGDEVTYNNVDYYVIKNSDATEENVTLLKAEPITSLEISPYLSSTEVEDKVDTTGTYIKMAYYSRDNCVSAGDQEGCNADYAVSDIKQVVDTWAKNNTTQKDLAADLFGYKIRLIMLDDLIDDMGYLYHEGASSIWYSKSDNTPNFILNNNHWYWTMSSVNYNVWCVGGVNNGDGDLVSWLVSSGGLEVRPVITIKKTALN